MHASANSGNLIQFSAVFLLVLLFSSNVFAVIEQSNLNIYAVTTEGEGVSAELRLKIIPGTGKIFTSIDPLIGTSTQTTLKTAVKVAEKKFKLDASKHDFYYEIVSPVSEVTGPSAGAGMTLLVVSALEDRPFPKNVSITGTITEEGFIGQVGGVYAKTKQAASDGKKLFLIPKGEAQQTVKLEEGVKKINLVDYAPKNLGINVLEVSNIEDAMKYAFSDISKLDFNVSEEEPFPEFVPAEINFSGHLMPFKKIINGQIVETKNILAEAKASLTNSMIADASTIAVLIEILDSAEQSFNQAKNLNDANYLYSAANYAFLAKANAMAVKDVASNPALIDSDSLELNEKTDLLKKELLAFENDLNKAVPAENFEWFITAQQRFSYAKQFIERISSTQTIVVGGDKYDAQTVELSRVSDYEFAKAWFEIAKEFHEFSVSGSNERISSAESFRDESDSLIAKTDALLSGKKKSESEDIFRRLNAAKEEKRKGWQLGALFDAASAYGLALSDSMNETDSNKARNELSLKINSLEQEISFSGKKFLWAKVYLDHARYFLLSGDFYLEKGFGAESIGSYKNGYSIALLAEQMFFASNSVQEIIRKSPELIVSQDEFRQPSIVSSNESVPAADFIVFFFGALMFVSIVVLFIELRISSNRKQDRAMQEIHHVKDLMRSLDESHMKGIIKNEAYLKKSKEYSHELNELKQKIRKKEQLGEELNENAKQKKAMIVSLKSRINALKEHYLEGFIPRPKFEKEKKELEKRIEELK